ncbi:MAG TPA: hypothetical protein VM242_09375 [Acidimicrobiales bacterium]|jgi:hypothetical protein|nr:hypothetical protein [Acidimicrobiales bacterium]
MTLQELVVLQPVRVPLWAWLFTAMAVLAVYLLALDNGLVLSRSASTVHELFHDARHFVGVPCH